MSTLFFAFANNPVALLPTLQEEEKALRRVLEPRDLDRHFSLKIESFITREDLPRRISSYRDDLTFFLFSGHTGRDRLLMSDGPANSDGLAQALGQCPRLKCVFLNGCSTNGQVARLLEAGVPVVIATSAPVGDRAATYFSTIFFETLAQQRMLKDAFETAKNALEIAFSETKPGAFRESGSAFSDDDEPEAATWGLFFKADNEHIPDEWRLPVSGSDQTAGVPFTPNQHLIDSLFQTLGPFSRDVNDLLTKAQSGQQISLAKKRMAVLNALPAPLAEPLRKLMVPVEEEKQGYDKISSSRLGQLVQAYQTALELLAFTMIAQLWEAFDKKGSLVLKPADSEWLGSLFRMSAKEREAFDWVPFIRAMREVFEANDIAYFMEELRQLRPLLASDPVFAEAVSFLRGLQRQFADRSFDENALHFLCKKGEESLAYLFGKLGFMARYRLATIQGIDVLKYRHRRQPSFSHTTVMLHDLLGGFEMSTVSLPDSLDNRSILLINNEAANWEYLNLSPFVMDENAFHDRTEICKLHFFSHYQKSRDTCFFKYVNRPDDPLLEVSAQRFGLLKEQFDAFAQHLLRQPMQNL